LGEEEEEEEEDDDDEEDVLVAIGPCRGNKNSLPVQLDVAKP
jgi:hypothetical protein